MNSWKIVLKGKKVTEGINYMNDYQKLLGKKCIGSNVEFFMDLGNLFEAISVAITYNISCLHEEYNMYRDEKKLGHEEALNACSILLKNAVKLHCQYYLFKRFYEICQEAPVELVHILKQLCLLYGLFCISENIGPYIESHYLNPIQSKCIRTCVRMKKKQNFEIVVYFSM
jgi:hypothetical protein